jgi:hypothetical protein
MEGDLILGELDDKESGSLIIKAIRNNICHVVVSGSQRSQERAFDR